MNALPKILLLLSFVALLAVGGFSVYKLVAKKENLKIANITQPPTPTLSMEYTPSSLPTERPSTTETPIFSPQPTKISLNPTEVPKPTNTLSPTPSSKITTLPTISPSPTLTTLPSPTQVLQTQLPSAGNGYSTLALLSLGFICLLTAALVI